MKVLESRVLPLSVVALFALGIGVLLGKHFTGQHTAPADETSFQHEMDAYCTAKLNDELSKLSADDKKTERTFFSRKLHTCVEVYEVSDPKDAGAMNYVVSDLTYGFVAPPNWHHSESPLHVYDTPIRSYHHLYAQGYWQAVGSDPGQQSAAQSNAVKLSCDYSDARGADPDSNTCTETQGYVRFGSIGTDTQSYHIASWSPDEVIATDAERGISGATTTTLLIHPHTNEIEIIDRTQMDEKQPDFNKGMAGKSFGDHYELHGGMYLIDTQGVFFQCNEDGPVIDMRLDVVEKHNGDVVDVPNSEWNAGAKSAHKFSQHECEVALKTKLDQIR